MSLPKASSKPSEATACPCESGQAYSHCCQPYHQGQAAPNALALMRSRYSAYAMGLERYLLDTWHPDTRPDQLNLEEDAPIQWLGLQIKQTATVSECQAKVEFVARYKVAGRAQHLHELSEFRQIGKRWYT